MVSVDFPIHLDPRTSPSEKISIFFEIYYPGKRVEVLPSKLLSSDFGQSECGSKNPWRSWNSHFNFSGGPIGTSWTSQKNFGVWRPHPMGGLGPPECLLWGSRELGELLGSKWMGNCLKTMYFWTFGTPLYVMAHPNERLIHKNVNKYFWYLLLNSIKLYLGINMAIIMVFFMLST